MNLCSISGRSSGPLGCLLERLQRLPTPSRRMAAFDSHSRVSPLVRSTRTRRLRDLPESQPACVLARADPPLDVLNLRSPRRSSIAGVPSHCLNSSAPLRLLIAPASLAHSTTMAMRASLPRLATAAGPQSTGQARRAPIRMTLPPVLSQNQQRKARRRRPSGPRPHAISEAIEMLRVRLSRPDGAQRADSRRDRTRSRLRAVHQDRLGQPVPQRHARPHLPAL